LGEREKERRTRYSVAQYYWAPDSKHLLFDALGQLWLYRLDTGTAVQITSSPERAGDPRFSPDGSHIAFIRKHNLFVARDGGSLRQLTHDTEDDILNGEVDWVYAEELDARHHYFWSPDSRQILFLQMNESAVPAYPLTDLLPTQPTVDMQKYPKPGDPNPQVRLGVVNANGGKVQWLKLPTESGDKESGLPQARESYIPRFGWLRPGIAWAEVLNRAQDRLDLYFVAVKSNLARLVLSERSPTWVNVDDNFAVVGEHRFLWTSWRDGHTHLYLYSFNGGDPTAQGAKLEAQLTRGAFEVFEVVHVDEQARLAYFTANAGDDRQRQLFRVRLDGSGFEQVSRAAGTHEPKFSPGGKWYVDKFSALMSPPQLSLCRIDGDGACNAFWEARSLAPYNLAPPQLVDFRANDGTVLHGELIMPPERPAGAKVPLVLYPYGGPGAQLVRDVWGGNRFLFNEVLAHEGMAVLSVDNRGSAGRGRAFAGVVRGEFGKTEIQDQLIALGQALERYPVLDKERVGCWGWSYGGSMTLWALTRTTAFKAGVAVAPVTDWRDYDSIYTERYLGLPQENAEGYRRSSPVTTVRDLHGSLLLLHGTGDDNVHLQNTMQMTQAFIDAGKRFQLMLYPRKLHSISGTAAQTDLFTRMEQHFEHELLGRP
jgi:dipeptidyl-peptidase-4